MRHYRALAVGLHAHGLRVAVAPDSRATVSALWRLRDAAARALATLHAHVVRSRSRHHMLTVEQLMRDVAQACDVVDAARAGVDGMHTDDRSDAPAVVFALWGVYRAVRRLGVARGLGERADAIGALGRALDEVGRQG